MFAWGVPYIFDVRARLAAAQMSAQSRQGVHLTSGRGLGRVGEPPPIATPLLVSNIRDTSVSE